MGKGTATMFLFSVGKQLPRHMPRGSLAARRIHPAKA
jgi:hypothetical protein